MVDRLARSAEEILGAEFWTQPEDVFETTFGLIYAQVASVLRDEWRARSGGAIDLLIIERIAQMYTYLRMREAFQDNAMTDRTRREMNKDFLDAAFSIKKLWMTEEGNSDASERVLKRVNEAVNDVIAAVPAEERAKLSGLLTDAFDNAGL